MLKGVKNKVEFGYFNGAGYMKINECSFIDHSAIELGDKTIIPGMFFSELGAGKRSFEMQEGYYLRYLGKVNDKGDSYLLFDVNDNDGFGWKYCFGYIDKNMLLNLCQGACYEIKIDKLKIIPGPKACFKPKQLKFFS